MNKFFEKLPFKKMAEKIPAGTRAKVPLLEKAIPFANQIACGLAVVLLVIIVACSGGKKDGGGGSAPRSNAKESPASDFSYDLSSDGQGIVIKGYTGKGGAVVIPAKIEDMPVVEIGEYAFAGALQPRNEPNNRDAITSIVVPASVVTIGRNAFYRIENLTSATLPDGLKMIPLYLFQYCGKLTTVNLPASLEEIDTGAFFRCGELNNLTIPASLSSIKFTGVITGTEGNEAFQGCSKLPIATRQKLQGLGYKDVF
jgi:hypothetical protein